MPRPLPSNPSPPISASVPESLPLPRILSPPPPRAPLPPRRRRPPAPCPRASLPGHLEPPAGSHPLRRSSLAPRLPAPPRPPPPTSPPPPAPTLASSCALRRRRLHRRPPANPRRRRPLHRTSFTAPVRPRHGRGAAPGVAARCACRAPGARLVGPRDGAAPPRAKLPRVYGWLVTPPHCF